MSTHAQSRSLFRFARAALYAVLLAVGTRSAAAQTPIDSMEIASVAFTGAQHFDDDLLATAIVTSATRCVAILPLCWLGIGLDRRYLSGRELIFDTLRLKLFYWQQGFREAAFRFDTTRVGERIRVTFRIVEGTPVRVGSIRFAVEDSVPPEVTRNLPLRVGDLFSEPVHSATRDTLTARLHNRGYARAEVLLGHSISSDSPYIAHVRYELIPGPRARFGPIEVVGASKVDSSVVRRMLVFGPGDLFTRNAILSSQRNLGAQEIFRHAEVQPIIDPASDTIVPVRVQVNEGDLHRVRVGVGASTAEYLNAEASWISRSFYGGARRLQLRGRVANLLATTLPELPIFEPSDDDFYGKLSGLISTDFTQPWFFGALNTLGLGIYAERRSIPDVFVRTAAGGYVTVNRSLGVGTSISAGYRPEFTKLETKESDLIFCLGFTACGAEDIGALRDLHSLAPFTLSFARDRSNSIFAPTRGYAVRFDAEFAARATGSDFGYTRLVAEWVDYHTVGGGVVAAVRLRPGWARALAGSGSLGVHPQKRFFAGGANSVRGFAQYRLGPKLLVADAVRLLALPVDSGGAACTAQAINDGSCDARELADTRPDEFRVQAVGGAVVLEGNLELRFPVLGERLRGAAFLDFGQVWDDDRSIDFRDVVWTPGIGVRYFSTIGPVRVDIGYYGGAGEELSVVTTDVCARTDDDPCAPIEEGKVYHHTQLRRGEDARLRVLAAPVQWNPRRSFFDRLQFHFSIGQAF